MYPSTAALDFYDQEFIKSGFETIEPDSYVGLHREWELAYNESEMQGKNPFHAQLDTFWINKKKNQMAWLILFFDWRNQSDNSKIESHTNLQGVNIEITFFDKSKIRGGINLKEIFPYRFASQENESEKKIAPESKLEGIYSLGKEKFSFRILNPLKKDLENWERMYDPKGNLNYVSKETKVSAD